MSDKKEAPLLSIDLNNDGDTIHFTLHTLEDAKEWIAAYRAKWSWVNIDSRRHNQIIQSTAQRILTFITNVERFLSQFESQNIGIDQLRRHLTPTFQSSWRKGWVPDHTPETEFVLQQRTTSDIRSLMALSYFQNGPTDPNQLSGELFEAQLDAMIFERQLANLEPAIQTSLSAATSAFESELTKLREQRDAQNQTWDNELSNIQNTLKQHSDNLQNLHDTRLKSLDAFISEAKEDIEGWKKAHREEINLKEPVTFWNNKRKSSFWSWIVLGVFFVAGLVAAGWILVKQSHTIYEGLKIGDSIEYWRIAAMLLLGGLAFWFLRILSKIFLSQLHAWSDAQERVTMVQTYLSLLQDEKGLDLNDRRLILEALFRPAPSGIIKDDGVPPAMFDMISRLK